MDVSDGPQSLFSATLAEAPAVFSEGHSQLSEAAKKKCDFFAKTCKKALSKLEEMGYNKKNTTIPKRKEPYKQGGFVRICSEV